MCIRDSSELYGTRTDFFLAVIFEKVDTVSRHPSQLYEAFFEGIILFILLNLLLPFSNIFCASK